MMRSVAVLVAVTLLTLSLAPAPLAFASGQTAVSTSGPNEAEAGFVNVFYAPGKAITCAGGSVLATVTLLITFGNAYDDAIQFLRGACGGPWLVAPGAGSAAADRAATQSR